MHEVLTIKPLDVQWVDELGKPYEDTGFAHCQCGEPVRTAVLELVQTAGGITLRIVKCNRCHVPLPAVVVPPE